LATGHSQIVSAKPAPHQPKQKSAYTRIIHHLEYISPRQGTVIELHRRLGLDVHILPADFERNLFEQTMTVRLGGVDVPTLPPEEHLAYLCAHGAYHAWVRIKWLCDIAACLRLPMSLDWEHFASEIPRMELERPVAQAMSLSQRLLDAPQPPSLQTLTGSVCALPGLLAAAEESMLLPEEKIHEIGGFHKVTSGLYRLKLRKGLKYKWHVILQTWLDEKDWREFPLPDSLFFLYFLLRPFLWLRRYFGRGKRRASTQV
jgi:hypothetical protein